MDEEEVAPTDISREFQDDVANGREPFCPRPWRTLKVTMTGQTKICCDFFTRLPEFDWPSAKDFHRPDGMWNHPFMQHLRGTMGMPDEVPYCTLCLTKDKRSPGHADLRADAKQKSMAVYRTFEERVLVESYRGTLGEHEQLTEFVHRLENGKNLRPFNKETPHYRRFIRSRHLFRRGRVLQVGASPPAMSAFLAEANDHLTVADSVPSRLERVRDLCASFDLEPQTTLVQPATAQPFGDDEYDAAFVDGTTLHRADRRQLLAEVARVVRSGGTVHVHRAPGPGALLQSATKAEGRELERIIAALSAGTSHDGTLSFVTGKDLRRISQRCGLSLDVSTPASQQWLPPTVEESLHAESADPEIWRLASTYAVRTEPDGPLGLEQTITFSTTVAPRASTGDALSGVGGSSAVMIGMPIRRD